MSQVELFLLFPESEPCNQFMHSNEAQQSEAGINRYVYALNTLLMSIAIESFDGFYDQKNVENFLTDFDTLEDYYPQPARRVLLSTITAYNDWRISVTQNPETAYIIHKQAIEDHSFCEIAQRKRSNIDHNYLLVSHAAHQLGDAFDVLFGNLITEVESKEDVEGIGEWFKTNRIPVRAFQVSDKHGENRQDIRIVRNKVISPLRCSGAEARAMLQDALGDQRGELFAYDHAKANFVVFKFEGTNPQNMYHGYHVQMDSDEVPDYIKAKLIDRHEARNQ